MGLSLDSDFTPLLRAAWNEFLDALYPLLCPLCGSSATDAFGCAAHRLPDGPPGARCSRCSAALAPALPDGERCPACRARSPGFRRLIALGDYRSQPALREWVLALKHGGRPQLAGPLGTLLGVRLAAHLAERPADEKRQTALLVPVPPHWLRRIERGYDQALLLARAVERAARQAQEQARKEAQDPTLAPAAGLQLARPIVRRRATALQGAPGAVSRSANVRAAFGLRRNAARRLAGRDLWLVDDVVTSGATVRECARLLRRAGARRVYVVCAARAG